MMEFKKMKDTWEEMERELKAAESFYKHGRIEGLLYGLFIGFAIGCIVIPVSINMYRQDEVQPIKNVCGMKRK